MSCFDSKQHNFNRSNVNLFKNPNYSDAVKANRIVVLTENTTKTNHNFCKYHFQLKFFLQKEFKLKIICIFVNYKKNLTKFILTANKKTKK